MMRAIAALLLTAVAACGNAAEFPSEQLLERVKRHEGFAPVPYVDTTGNWTVGYGHNLEGKPASHLNWSKDQALVVLKSDLANARTDANMELGSRAAWAALHATCKDVLIELAFQLGRERLSGFHKMLAAFRQLDYRTAAAELKNSHLYRELKNRTDEQLRLLAVC